METNKLTKQIPQYSLGKILSVWALAAIPMGFLGWVVAPAFAQDPSKPSFERLAILTIGLVWQFLLVIILLYQETGTLQWSIIKERLWLNSPHATNTDENNNRLWWWIIPLLLLTTIFELLLLGPIEKVWVSIFPFFAEPAGFSLGSNLTTSEAQSQLVGAWGIYALFLIQALFNTVLGEELLFRGLLLPRMKGAFGKWDWVMNGFLFGIYHLHQPWGMFTSALEGIFLLAFPSRKFRSAWFGIILHSGQSIFFAILLLGLVLGLAK